MQSEPAQDRHAAPAGVAGAHRAFVGPMEQYDRTAALQFTLMVFLGLREHHSLLDIGCGSLRGGRLFIPYLLPGQYCGIEPEPWLIEAATENELGKDLLRIKRPEFSNDRDFTLSTFGRQFDYLVAQSIFSHASEAQITRCLSEARKVMTPTSIFAATFREGASNYTGDAWVYPGCSTYRREHMAALVEQQGLVCRVLGWPHPNRQTWIAILHEEGVMRLPAALCGEEVPRDILALFTRLFGLPVDQPWEERRRLALDELTALIPPGETFILVDEEQWGVPEELGGRRRIPFLERSGVYWGSPADSETGIRELDRLRRAGATFIVFGWPAFWWLAHYSGLHQHLRSQFPCLLENDRLTAFDLRR
jgi:hypothetical protein